MAYWLMKSEPDELSIDDLASQPNRLFAWDGVRNHRARNWMAEMADGDRFLFAHSSCKVPGIAGIGEIVGAVRPDPLDPRWVVRDVRFVERFDEVLSLRALREQAEELGPFHLLRRANRLSVMPVTDEQWRIIGARARPGFSAGRAGPSEGSDRQGRTGSDC